jgi:hypothetical protein
VYLLALEGVVKFVELGLEWWRGEALDLLTLVAGVVLIHGAACLLERKRVWWFLACAWLGVRAVALAFVFLPLYVFDELLPARMGPALPPGRLFSGMPTPQARVLLLYVLWIICFWQWWAIGRPGAGKLFWQKSPPAQAAQPTIS